MYLIFTAKSLYIPNICSNFVADLFTNNYMFKNY